MLELALQVKSMGTVCSKPIPRWGAGIEGPQEALTFACKRLGTDSTNCNTLTYKEFTTGDMCKADKTSTFGMLIGDGALCRQIFIALGPMKSKDRCDHAETKVACKWRSSKCVPTCNPTPFMPPGAAKVCGGKPCDKVTPQGFPAEDPDPPGWGKQEPPAPKPDPPPPPPPPFVVPKPAPKPPTKPTDPTPIFLACAKVKVRSECTTHNYLHFRIKYQVIYPTSKKKRCGHSESRPACAWLNNKCQASCGCGTATSAIPCPAPRPITPLGQACGKVFPMAQKQCEVKPFGVTYAKFKRQGVDFPATTKKRCGHKMTDNACKWDSTTNTCVARCGCGTAEAPTMCRRRRGDTDSTDAEPGLSDATAVDVEAPPAFVPTTSRPAYNRKRRASTSDGCLVAQVPGRAPCDPAFELIVSTGDDTSKIEKASLCVSSLRFIFFFSFKTCLYLI